VAVRASGGGRKDGPVGGEGSGEEAESKASSSGEGPSRDVPDALELLQLGFGGCFQSVRLAGGWCWFVLK
jgi:hypothetical protein